MAVLSSLVQKKIDRYESLSDQTQSQLESLRLENQRLKARVEQLEDLIADATPLLWVYGAPSFQRAVESACRWEVRAQEVVRGSEATGI
jgi:cell division protein FtsB